MFGAIKNTMNNDIETIIGKNTVFKGELSGSSTLRIDGTVEGNISITESVIIGENGYVKGNISAKELLLSGQVDGNVSISKCLHVYATGRLDGDIKANSLIIDNGGTFKGCSDMGLKDFEPLFSS